MNAETFFVTQWYRSMLLAELNIVENEKLSFNDLRLQVAQKHLGNYVDTIEFKKQWLQHEIEVLEFCINRDQANFDSKPKSKQRKSGLPWEIEHNKKNLACLKIRLKAMNKKAKI